MSGRFSGRLYFDWQVKMPNQIQILPEVLCNKIAAGEVVERPASAVKELIENAIDAGATQIVVEIEKGGKRLVRVSDNGCGMGREDLFLSLERHATSKISSETDLFQLHTLGFRGEALPSIAAVSRMVLRSRTAAEEAGWEIYLESGLIKRADAVGMATGSVVEVRDLFYKMPARKKFLRRDETELGHIGEVVTKLALARPDIGFKLYHHGRALIDVFPGQSLLDRTGALLNRSLLKDLRPVERQGAVLKIDGLLGTPAVSRATTGFIYTFINGRFIRDRVVQHAVLEGYRHLLPRGRYPVVVLFLQLDPELVDVNVHPTKHEVRFRQQSEVHDFLVETVKNVLRGSDWLADDSVRSVAPAVGTHASFSLTASRKAVDPGDREETKAAGVAEQPASYTPLSSGAGSAPEQDRQPYAPAAINPAPVSVPVDESLFSDAKGFFASLVMIGQYHNSYLLCQDDHDLVIIDQHAAHERIGFERFKRQWNAGRIECQQLLFPAMLELSHQEADQLQQQLAKLDQLGFEIEPFGGNSFAIKSVPQILHDVDAVALVRDVVAELVVVGKSLLIEDAVDKILILMSCHGMIRANQPLTAQEIRALLGDLDTVDFNAQCPHGRPVLHRIPLVEMERFFKRG
ncbi:MAG TPA: DNA mismatch repair endonuclease MutL [Geothermobacteraceae bacterium]|nr:DNA mismatch repair endonuclease MutL [Geothermobacteraceae bacterium]